MMQKRNMGIWEVFHTNDYILMRAGTDYKMFKITLRIHEFTNQPRNDYLSGKGRLPGEQLSCHISCAGQISRVFRLVTAKMSTLKLPTVATLEAKVSTLKCPHGQNLNVPSTICICCSNGQHQFGNL